MNKKAFNTQEIAPGIEILTIQGGSVIYMASGQSFNDTNDKLDQALRATYLKTTVKRARVMGFVPSGDGKHFDISAIAIDELGDIIPSKTSQIQFKIKADTELDIDVWSENEKAVKSLAAKSNTRNAKGMRNLMTELQACILECETANREFDNDFTDLEVQKPARKVAVAIQEEDEDHPSREYFGPEQKNKEVKTED